MRFIIIIIVINIITIINLIPAVLATDSTPSADIKAKLEELKKEIASKAAKLKQEVNQKLQNKAYVGKVKTHSSSSLTLATRTGPKIVNLNQDTIYDSRIKIKQKFSAKTLAEEDDVAALGDIDDNGVLTAKKIILLNPNPYTLNPKSYLWGQIVSISDKLATLKDHNLKNIALSLPQSSVKLNDFVILTGNFNKNDIFETGFVYIIPQGGILKPKKIATPSAQVATPSAKVKPSTR